MRPIEIHSHQYQGLQKKDVLVQALKTRGLAQLSLSGNLSPTLRDARDKLRAVVAQRCTWGPVDRVLVHLLPVDLPKFSPELELPIALAISASLCADFLKADALERLSMMKISGSLTLTGELVDAECEYPNRVRLSFSTFEEVWRHVLTGESFEKAKLLQMHSQQIEMVAAKGRYWEKLLLLASSIAHLPVLLLGAPGVGKTHLAKWALRLVPEPNEAERAEIERIWNLAGQETCPQIPSQNPHARTALAEFVGVSRHDMPRPGIFSLSHGGLLILDEFSELARDAREILRNVLDEKHVLRNTKAGFVKWPAKFWLILTSNPCPCGYAQGSDLSRCRCPEGTRLKYLTRFSGPLLDRMGAKCFLRELPPTADARDEELAKELAWLDEFPYGDLQDRLQELRSRYENIAAKNSVKGTFSERSFKANQKMQRAFEAVLGSAQYEKFFEAYLCEQRKFRSELFARDGDEFA